MLYSLGLKKKIVCFRFPTEPIKTSATQIYFMDFLKKKKIFFFFLENPLILIISICIGTIAFSTGGMDPFLELSWHLNISRKRFKSVVYGGVYSFCRTWSIFFSNVRL